MIIDKVLNNNVIVVFNENNQEQILMGRGIAFNKKVGDSYDKNKIEKVFLMEDADKNNKFQELLKDLPVEHLEVTESIIRLAEKDLNTTLNEMVYVNLADHITSAIKRYLDGFEIKNGLLWDIKKFYEKEYRVGNQAVGLINQRLKVALSEDEAGFIALHIVNAELNSVEDNDIYKITKVIQEMANIVKYAYSVELDEDNVYYYRFIVHLRYFASRMFNATNANSEDIEPEFYEVVKHKFSEAYKIVLKVGDFLQRKYHYRLTKEDQVFLTIHVARIYVKAQKKEQH